MNILRRSRPLWLSVLALSVLAVSAAGPWSASAQELPTSPPWNGQPISPGLGPTYGEQWCAAPAPGTSIANQQAAPLALIPQEAVGCTLEKIEAEGKAKGLPDRMDHSVIGKSAGGRDVYGVVVNALETEQQRRDYARWQQIREIELEEPARAQQLLAGFGTDVKMPVFIQANIHGNEEEGADAIMQVLRDLVTTPRGQNAMVDAILDHVILIVIPMENPDGRFAGTRANANNFDMNRDWIVQSQPEVRASVRLQQEWLATAGLDMHGYVNPMLVDGTTKPHNPGLEYDLFLKWNQQRLDANTVALAGVGMPINRPVNSWNPSGLPVPVGHPYIAEGWDDWGPFYTQTYMAFYGVDSSTPEMCSTPAGGGVCDGRLGSKTGQYVTFYSSLKLWIENRQKMMNDQLEIFRRGVEGAARTPCCADPGIAARGFTEDQHNWMQEIPKAYVIPFGRGQRSDAEANRMVRWLLANGIEVERATRILTFDGKAYPKGSYVIPMNQALRGLAFTALSAGQDISNRILRLYATPAAWSHGLMWGADVVEVPRNAAFSPSTRRIDDPNQLDGGINGGVGAPADWYATTLRGITEYRALHALLEAGLDAELAEEPFETTTAGILPSGSLIFRGDPGTAFALETFGRFTGVVFERSVGIPKPATATVAEEPRIAILVNSASPATNDTSESLETIYGDDARFVSVTAGPSSLENAAEDPLKDIDVIYNSTQGWPAGAKARERLNAFFARGGGYVSTSQTGNGFLNNSGQVSGTLTESSQTAYGGIAIWRNVSGPDSPVTGGYPSTDYLHLPSNITYFTSTPTGSVIDGRYHQDMTGAVPMLNGPSQGFVAGLWRTRGAAANDAPVMVRGTLSGGGKWFSLAANPFARQDGERVWPLIAQAALWSNRTDEVTTQGAATEAASSLTPGFSLASGTPAGSPELPRLAGVWEGTWTAADGTHGELDLVLSQDGSVVAGRGSMTGAGCGVRTPADGRLAGPRVRFGIGSASFEGVVEGGTMTGTFTGGCGGEGTWELAKEHTRAAD